MHCRHEIINWNNESLEKDLFNPVAGPTGFFHAFFSPSILEGSVSICFFPRKNDLRSFICRAVSLREAGW